MLKKIFAVFCAGMFFVVGMANATIDARKECVSRGGGFGYDRDAEEKPWLTADYQIFFDNDRSNIPDDCKDEVDNLVDELKNKQDDIETVLLFGSTDSTGDSQYNAKLAQDRVNTVNKRLTEAGVPVCMYDEDGNATSRCAHMSMGESFTAARELDNISKYYLRAVSLFVIYKSDICDDSTFNLLTKMSAQLPNDSGLKQARELCPKSGVVLLRSKRKQVMDAMYNAYVKNPNLQLPANEKALFIIYALDIANGEFMGHRSVWKSSNGSFNYARLASDSIAGVVLGTVGGIITSNVVKKNQIKGGFEDIMCTVGGQNVASWGDEFQVGVK